MEPRLTPTVGLEIHVRLNTGRKLFCACSYDFRAPPGTCCCPVCLGLPGSLPVLDQAAVDKALRAGAALGCRVHRESEFARKNYFYPDLPRNFQITQYDRPLLTGGELAIPGAREDRVRLRRIHLEEDAGRSLQGTGAAGSSVTRIDANRAGTPLMEIVTEPDLKDGRQVRLWLGHLLQILEYLEVCDGILAEGSLRCDANVGLAGFGPLTELKNLNSFRFIGHAVDFEIDRLARRVAAGRVPAVQTRTWDPSARCTRFLRRKEATRDYRFFPEPDLPPLVVDPGRQARAASGLPELPAAREARLARQYAISAETARTLCRTRAVADYFEEGTSALASRAGCGQAEAAEPTANWILGPLLHRAENVGWAATEQLAPADRLAEILLLVLHREISGKVASRLLDRLLEEGPRFRPAEVVRREGLGLINDLTALGQVCRDVILDNPAQADRVRRGEKKVLEFLLGQVMGRTGGRADPAIARELLEKVLAPVE